MAAIDDLTSAVSNLTVQVADLTARINALPAGNTDDAAVEAQTALVNTASSDLQALAQPPAPPAA